MTATEQETAVVTMPIEVITYSIRSFPSEKLHTLVAVNGFAVACSCWGWHYNGPTMGTESCRHLRAFNAGNIRVLYEGSKERMAVDTEWQRIQTSYSNGSNRTS